MTSNRLIIMSFKKVARAEVLTINQCLIDRPNASVSELSGTSTASSHIAQELTPLIKNVCFHESSCIFVFIRVNFDVWFICCFTSHSTIFQSYMTVHRCARGLRKNVTLPSDSHATVIKADL